MTALAKSPSHEKHLGHDISKFYNRTYCRNAKAVAFYVEAYPVALTNLFRFRFR